MQVTISEILKFLDDRGIQYTYTGKTVTSISGFSSINQLKTDSISWIKNPNVLDEEKRKSARRVLFVIPEGINAEMETCDFLITDSPKSVFFSILNHFFKKQSNYEICKTSIVKSNNIGKNVSIGNFCYIGSDVEIGDNTIIEHNVTIMNHAIIGSNCIIHSGVVIGADGYGYYIDKNCIPIKEEHYGGVTVGNYVEVGCNTCIDRGTIDNTVIGDNVKIDNLCHIAHNTIIEDNAMIVAEAVILGSAKVGRNSYVAPASVLKNQKKVGENSLVGMGAVVIEDVPDNAVVAGIPARIIKYGNKNNYI